MAASLLTPASLRLLTLSFASKKEGQEMCYFTLSTASGKEMSK